MKLSILSTLAISAFMMVSCNEAEAPAQTETASTTEAVEEVSIEKFTADAEVSKVNWKGEVAGVYSHEGFVNLESGSISMNGEKIVGGEFVIDMTGIFPTDSASYSDEEGHRASDLAGHLSTEDFFATATYPTATFVVTATEGNSLKGNLTIRDKTLEETLEVESLEVVNGVVTMTGKLVFNRQNYDVAWKHYMKDMVLSNDIAINYTLVAKKS